MFNFVQCLIIILGNNKTDNTKDREKKGLNIMNEIEELMKEIENENLPDLTEEQSRKMFEEIMKQIHEYEEYKKAERFLKEIFED